MYFRDELRDVMLAFELKSKLPNVAGAIDGCHIRILEPWKDPAAYINRKIYASLILQATVDPFNKFTSCFFGYPGSAHDARVFSNSAMARMLSNDTFCGGQRVNVLGYNLPVCLIGDSAYPLKRNLMVVCEIIMYFRFLIRTNIICYILFAYFSPIKLI